jgi:hypothetical protein
MRTLFCTALFSGSLIAMAGSAHAQDRTYVERQNAEGQDIRFIDDPLDAVGRDTVGAQITSFITARRFQLARPRQSFVPEMIKNVESL